MCPGVHFGAHVTGRTGHSAFTVNDCERLRAVAAVALPLGARFSGRTVTRADWLWASALTAAIAGQSAFQVGALQASLPATAAVRADAHSQSARVTVRPENLAPSGSANSSDSTESVTVIHCKCRMSGSPGDVSADA